MSDIAELLTRLDKVTGKFPKWKAICPAHADKSPSLSIKEISDGTILIHCFAGCGPSDIMDAIGMSLSELFPERAGRKDWRKESDKRNIKAEQERTAFLNEIFYICQIRKLEAALARKKAHV